MAYDVGALRKSIALLEVLAASDQPLGVTELAARAGVAKNMAFRACQTLVDLGWLAASGEPPRYRLTLVPFHLFAHPLERSQLTTAAHEPLRTLAAASGETAYLAVRDGARAVNVQVVEGAGPIRVAGGVGAAFPLHATAQGKVLLAFDPAARRELPPRLSRHSTRTLIARRALETELASVRAQGWAANREEYATGLVGCAAPVRDREDRCVAAIGVFATTTTVDEERLGTELATAVRAAAATIEAALGRDLR